ncbi:DEAD/DEAH box helicase family protein [Phototrophicus methaneseepsis]|uniref:3'-5' exonuclease DinG n=1 Tax=Phototrophicus methaneseepsis TaxID=2710758 RepID=A0A7S8E6C6_9CHLR|nr:helicase C-terminal domain-containing protein [Phototrophicus methaneseepsis]QPC81109.1 DEAD/DEAH box helicase family protein [Phototrophicus methaneseepsis]
MRGELVAFDLETTGLDIQNDAIIEIGAVRIVDGVIDAEYSTLINPGFAIPQETTYITGIDQRDVKDAPSLNMILPDFQRFVGDAPVIAHNAMFDVGFMRRYGMLTGNSPIDTVELASILMPQLPRYNLGSLVKLLDIDLENAHRALDDARATGKLYWLLWQKALNLPPSVIQEIARYGSGIDWDLNVFFKACAAETAQTGNGEFAIDFAENEQSIIPDRAAQTPSSRALITKEEIASILGPEGKLSQTINNYEYREQQVSMADSVADAFNNQQHVMIEAGTGTGKSLAYLVPAALWATENKERVVISTNTINLQEQLIQKDIPLLHDVIEQPFTAAVMKGRGNYLCPRRLAAMRRRLPTSIDELRMMVKLLVWLSETNTGDRGEITLRGNENYIWTRLSAQDEGCTTRRCIASMHGTCPYHQARQRAEAADLLVVNHALLVSDALNANGQTLPPYQHVIIDEAHQLEDAVTNGLNTRIDQVTLAQRLAELGGANRGLMGDILNQLRGAAPDKTVMKLEAFTQNVDMAVKAMLVHVTRFFETLADFVNDTGQNNKSQIRITESSRTLSEFTRVQIRWEQLSEFFDVIADAMTHILGTLHDLESSSIDIDDQINSVAATARYLSDVRHQIDAFANDADDNTVYWIHNAQYSDYIAIQTAPQHAGRYIEETLWQRKETIVLTSATMQTGNDFAYMKDRLHAERLRASTVGSPFDYEKSAMIYIPEDMPEPNRPNYQKMVERGIINLATALNGRVMVLFTSYSQLKETATNIAARLALGDIVVYDQATGTSRESLLDNFKSTEKAVLLGTRSFWDGVDIPGEDLSALVIVRLPFAVPTDPVFAARSEMYDDAFHNYAVPNAILRFRQGFGRLIRTQHDRGIVTIFDSRIINKKYGSQFLEALPACTVQRGPLDNLGAAAQHWLSTTKA